MDTATNETKAKAKTAPSPAAPPPVQGPLVTEPIAPSANDIVERLQQQCGPVTDTHQQRQSERFSWVTNLTLVIQDPLGKPRTLDVVTHDISKGGFSFMYRQFLHQGTKIRIFFDGLPDRPQLTGVVQNCAYVGGMHHRVGVRFCTLADEPTKSSANPRS